MKSLFLDKKIHFIGVGGISMNALAKYALLQGAKISGSDLVWSTRLAELEVLGAKVWQGSCPYLIDADMVVFSSAIPQNDAELVYCKNRKIVCQERFEFLRTISQNFGCCVAIAGTHGKTTATAMLTSILLEANSKFTAHIGGEVVGLGNLIVRGDDIFLTEACEFRRSFLELSPNIAVVLNIESDHPDCYRDVEELEEAFQTFAMNTKPDGIVILPCEYKYILTKSHKICFQTVNSMNSFCDYMAEIVGQQNGMFTFDVIEKGKNIARVELNVKGKHNISNALASFCVARQLDIDIDCIVKGLENFQGVKRRFETYGKIENTPVIFDYAHHPSEIISSIECAKSTYEKVMVVFQPHTFSRSASLIEGFKNCFYGANWLGVLPTYSAREKKEDGIDSEKLFEEILKNSANLKTTKKYVFLHDFDEAVANIKKHASQFDCILVLGAGDVIDIAQMLFENPV